MSLNSHTSFRSAPAARTLRSSARPFVASRPLAVRFSLGDPRFDRAAPSAPGGLWNRSLLDRLQTPLTRYRD